MKKINLKNARKLAIAAQGLLQSKPFGRTKNGTLACLQHLSYVQIDTISVVQRAHHHVLWSRVPDYQPDMLHGLQRQKSIFEYWSHAAAYLPMRDFRYYLPMMHAHRRDKLHWFAKDHKLMDSVLARIAGEGPLTARDFQHPDERRNGAWWDWKPAKKALEQLFMEGRLVVVERKNFQKVYDMPERALPSDLDTSLPTTLEMVKFLVRSTIAAHGFVQEKDVNYLRPRLKSAVKQAVGELLESGEMTKLEIAEVPGVSFLSTPDLLASASRLRRQNRIHLLSPFDNAVIRRKRLQILFDFDYQLECYVPQSKRKFGYFCLPILWGDQFIGRVDAKAERASKRMILQHVVFENERAAEPSLAAFAQAVQHFAEFNGCEKIELRRVQPERLAKEVIRILKADL